MFEKLSEKLTGALQKLIGHGKITDSVLDTALQEVRIALLEADVNYNVVKNFLGQVRQKALGQVVIKSLTAGQHVIKVVNEELTALMGGSFEGLDFSQDLPIVVMLVGLQGSGKTTTAAKLALLLKKNNHKPYLVPADVARPAAITQLTVLGEQVDAPVFPSTTEMTPADISKKAVAIAKEEGYDVVLIDTAGRLSIDVPLMTELSEVKKVSGASEIILVADAMTGQEAVNIAKDFNDRLDLTGVILSKMEGDARGGAAMSMRAIIQKPLKYIGTGEKLENLEPFHPDRVASMILGMGDILTLIEKAQETVDAEQSEKLVQKMSTGSFNLEDFREQLRNLKKIGTVNSILGMIPGLGSLKKFKETTPDELALKRFEAIIDSMTREERITPTIINASRRKRVAKGSGTSVREVNQLLKNFSKMQGMLRQMARGNFSPQAFKNLLG
ncbi:MAG: signal recognition particle protein [Deltaproteobacteria bacterium]|jgi:signal recognition particle subunit SRP54|nr:signal recognition particle protein [Deltaproteobacteria bacterium]